MHKSRMRYIDRRINPPRIHGAVSANPRKSSGRRLKFGMEAIGRVIRIHETGVELDIEGVPGFLPIRPAGTVPASRNDVFLRPRQLLPVRVVRRGTDKDRPAIVTLEGLDLCKRKRGEHVGLVITSRHRRDWS